MPGCTHRKVTTYVFVDSNEPSGLWACADCGHKFAPVDLTMEKDAERYRWHKARTPSILLANAWGASKAACEIGGDPDAATDAAMAEAPAIGAA